jgi:hypothetical protein
MRRGAIGSVVSLLLIAAQGGANVSVETPPGFQHRFDEQVNAALASLARSEDAPIRQLHEAVVSSPATIVIRPITNDRSTWHSSGDPDRRHTEPADGGSKATGRRKPTGAIVYIQVVDVDSRSAIWNQGVLVHELVHAVDLAYGRYHPDDTVRERRAVFLQNVWRARFGNSLRSTYHGHFATTDYQDAKRRGMLNEYARYIFTRADLPSPR